MADEKYAWLDENGICFFSDQEAIIPVGVNIRAPNVQAQDLIKSYVVLDGGEIKQVGFASLTPDSKVIGVEGNELVINWLMKTYQGKGITYTMSNGPQDALPWGIGDSDDAKKLRAEGLQILGMEAIKDLKAGSGVHTRAPLGRKTYGVHAQYVPGSGTMTMTDPGHAVRLGKGQQ